MSVRVNLLPGDVEARNKAARQRAGVGVAAVVFLGVLIALYLFQLGRVSDAQAQLDTEQQRLSALQTELQALNEFQELERRAAESEDLIVAALAGEASIAGILQDLAAVMPTDADLLTLGIGLVGEPAGTPDLGAERASYGSLTADGRTIRGHAPGLERLLLELEKPASFGDVYFGASILDPEAGYVTFGVEVELGPEILTRRYANGLPEELR